MSHGFPNILILGHSFVCCLLDNLKANWDFCTAQNFHIPKSGYVTMLDTEGRTIENIVKYDLPYVQTSKPDVLWFLSWAQRSIWSHPEVVGLKVEKLALLFCYKFHAHVLGVCQVTNRNIAKMQEADSVFNAKAALLRQYLSVVLADISRAFFFKNIGHFFIPLVFCYPRMTFIVTHRGNIVCTGAMLFVQELSEGQF